MMIMMMTENLMMIARKDMWLPKNLTSLFFFFLLEVELEYNCAYIFLFPPQEDLVSMYPLKDTGIK